MARKLNYRQKYKEHYNIEFGKEYVIHHIDEDRENNDISNLLLLPRDLHSKYHTYKNEFDRIAENGLCFELNDFGRCMRYLQLGSLDILLNTIAEIQKWVHYKWAYDNCGIEYPMFERRK